MKHKWKEFANLINAPYRKRFSTNGYGDLKIDNKGVYVYGECNGYIDWDYTGGITISQMLDGDLKIKEE